MTEVSPSCERNSESHRHHCSQITALSETVIDHSVPFPCAGCPAQSPNMPVISMQSVIADDPRHPKKGTNAMSPSIDHHRHAVSVGGRTSDPKRGSQQERESDFKLPLSFTHPHPRLVRSCDERSSTTHVPSSSYPHITPPPCAHHTNPPSLACIASTKACNTSSDDS